MAPARTHLESSPASFAKRSSAVGTGIVGSSAAMHTLRATVVHAASTSHDVLVVGESGTGKRSVARAIHALGDCASDRFVTIDPVLFEAPHAERDLFGSASRAHSSAALASIGRIVGAQHGTLYVSELLAVPPELQARILALLERRTVRPVGTDDEARVDLRVVAASAHDVNVAVERGLLRRDLLDRLAPLSIHVPPLRHHRDDIPELVAHFLHGFCNRQCGCIEGVSADGISTLQAYHWPGNVRELRSAIEHAISCGQSDCLVPRDFPATVAAAAPARATPMRAPAALPTLAQAEYDLVRRALAHCGGNKVHAARALGISRHKLYEVLRRSGPSTSETS